MAGALCLNTLRRFACVGIAATCSFMVTDCLAADLTVVNSMPIKALPIADYDWTGFYVARLRLGKLELGGYGRRRQRLRLPKLLARGGNRYVLPNATAPHLDSTANGGKRDMVPAAHFSRD